MEKFACVIDYGLGNLRSVSKAFEAVGAKVKVTSRAQDIASADVLVLPGVGAFKRAIDNLLRLDIIASILKAVKEGKPILGICLGLQIFFTESEEHGYNRGLDIIKGKVKKFPSCVKIPHMGWNQLKIKNEKSSLDFARDRKIKIFDGIPDESYFYFVHSYYVEPEDEDVVIASTEYGQDFVSMINKKNVWGVQFHPEKSAELGLKILENFLRC